MMFSQDARRSPERQKVGTMKSPIIRLLLLLALPLLLLGSRPCTKHAQDVCLGVAVGDPCEIDRGCDEPADPGTCQGMGENGDIMTCIPN
jgi:hypothetical protein